MFDMEAALRQKEIRKANVEAWRRCFTKPFADFGYWSTWIDATDTDAAADFIEETDTAILAHILCDLIKEIMPDDYYRDDPQQEIS